MPEPNPRTLTVCFDGSPRPSGCAIAVDGSHALTCSHVISLALGRNPRETEPPSPDQVRQLYLAVPADPKSQVRFQVVYWLPIADPNRDGRPQDLAVLECRDGTVWQEPRADTPISRAIPDMGDSIFSYNAVTGQFACMLVHIRRPNGWLQLGRDPNYPGPSIEPGASGGPAVTSSNELVGMIVSADVAVGLGWYVPTLVLEESWPSLTNILNRTAPDPTELHALEYIYWRTRVRADLGPVHAVDVDTVFPRRVARAIPGLVKRELLQPPDLLQQPPDRRARASQHAEPPTCLVSVTRAGRGLLGRARRIVAWAKSRECYDLLTICASVIAIFAIVQVPLQLDHPLDSMRALLNNVLQNHDYLIRVLQIAALWVVVGEAILLMLRHVCHGTCGYLGGLRWYRWALIAVTDSVPFFCVAIALRQYARDYGLPESDWALSVIGIGAGMMSAMRTAIALPRVRSLFALCALILVFAVLWRTRQIENPPTGRLTGFMLPLDATEIVISICSMTMLIWTCDDFVRDRLRRHRIVAANNAA